MSGPQGMQQEMQQLYRGVRRETSFIEPELLHVGSATIESVHRRPNRG